jgi:hypothetical protein
MNIQHKPALIVGFVGAILALLVAFGVKLTDAQDAAILGAVTSALAMVSAFWPWEPPKSGAAPKAPPGVATMALFALALACGCTPAEQQTASTIATGGEVACMMVMSIEDPALEPVCATGEEIVKIVIAYVASHNGQPPTVTTDAATGVTKISSDAFKALAARPEVRTRWVNRCAKVTTGKVSP